MSEYEEPLHPLISIHLLAYCLLWFSALLGKTDLNLSESWPLHALGVLAILLLASKIIKRIKNKAPVLRSLISIDITNSRNY